MTDKTFNFQHLPPEEVRLFNIKNDEPLDTPLDDKGLVDLDSLIQTVKSTVVPDYNWASRLNDVHHLQWYSGLYKEHNNSELALEFRNLVNRKAYVPRVFHNWLHRITMPPPVPDEYAMHYSIEAQRVALSLYETASNAMRLSRSKTIGERALKTKLENAFEFYNVYLNNAREVPEEFSLVKIEELEARSVEDMLSVNRVLGRMALNRIPRRSKLIQAVA